MTVTLSKLKSHLRVTEDDEDTALSALIISAQKHIERLLGFTFETAEESDPPRVGFEDGVPADLDQAVLMLAGSWYENRETVMVGQSVATMPANVDDIIREHRNWTF